jgi:NTE family protein
MRKPLFASILFFFSYTVFAQQIRNLVFEGAGVRGLAYSGAIHELENQNILSGVRKVGGTSAGAIVALCISLGYSAAEMKEIVETMRLQRFNDGRFFFIGGFSRLNRRYGWYRGRAFSRWLEKIILNKTGNPDITFQQLGENGFKDLYVTGTSLTQQKLIIFSKETYPSMKVRDAVRISMSIPLYFEAVCIDSLGKVIRCRKADGTYDLMIDGGMTGNFPISMFDSVSTGRKVVNQETLGFRIDSPEQIEYDKKGSGLAPYKILRFKNYLGAFYNYAIENLNRQHLSEDDWKRTVSISSGSVGPKIKRLSSPEKNELIENGRKATSNFLAQIQRHP